MTVSRLNRAERVLFWNQLKISALNLRRLAEREREKCVYLRISSSMDSSMPPQATDVSVTLRPQIKARANLR